MLKTVLWQTLLRLSELGANYRTIEISTNELAREMCISQQTASRHLIELERLGLVERTVSFRGMEVKITSKGKEDLRRVYLKLKSIVEGSRVAILLEGRVCAGLGEGAYYMSQRGYKRQFIEKLGFDPYPGTLNLELSTQSDVKAKAELESHPAITIEGFNDGKRTFGPVSCYPATINDEVQGVVVIINRTHHEPSILEVVAAVNLRDRLGLRDRSRVWIKASPYTLRTKGN